MIYHIDDVKPGMVLLEDVLASNGAVLINGGKELTEGVIAILKRKGIEHIEMAAESSQECFLENNGDATFDIPREIFNAVEPQEAPEDFKEPVPETGNENPEPPAGTGETEPHYEIIVSDDFLSAKFRVEPRKESSNEISVDGIQKALNDAGVVYGIDRDKITQLVSKWQKLKKFYEVENIAVAARAQPGKEGAFKFKVEHLIDDECIASAREAKYFWQVVALGKDVERVDPGTVIAEKVISTPPIPGTDVRGELVFTEEMVKAEETLASSVEYSSDGMQVVSTAVGVAFHTDKSEVGVIPLDFDGSVDCVISNDRMSANVIVHPPGRGGKVPGRAGIESILKENNVVFGIKKQVLDALCNDLAAGKVPREPVTVAEGTAPKDGENGRVEFLFNVETSLQPKENNDGSVDFKNVDIVNFVSKGDKLARLVYPSESTPGTDVRGQEIPAKDGTGLALPTGTNTEPSPDDPALLISSVDGNARLNGSVVEVNEGFVINGDIDFSTGNVRYGKSVTVGGDIRSGFSVEAGGDLQVNGIIEDARIVAGGSVLCKHGFVGQGKGVIDARGDVNIGFLKNQTIRSRGTVSIAREALNATIYARKSVFIHGKPLSIAGGTVVARDLIEIETVGSRSGIRTMLEVGLDYTLSEEMEKTDRQTGEVTENMKKIFETYKRFEQKLKLQRKLPARDQELYDKIKKTLLKYRRQIKALEQRKEVISAKMHAFDNACIKIKHSALPGTLIKIGERHLLVKEEIIGPKSIRFMNFEIKIL